MSIILIQPGITTDAAIDIWNQIINKVNDLDTDKQDTADDTLDTTDQTVTGAINELHTSKKEKNYYPLLHRVSQRLSEFDYIDLGSYSTMSDPIPLVISPTYPSEAITQLAMATTIMQTVLDSLEIMLDHLMTLKDKMTQVSNGTLSAAEKISKYEDVPTIIQTVIAYVYGDASLGIAGCNYEGNLLFDYDNGVSYSIQCGTSINSPKEFQITGADWTLEYNAIIEAMLDRANQAVVYLQGDATGDDSPIALEILDLTNEILRYLYGYKNFTGGNMDAIYNISSLMTDFVAAETLAAHRYAYSTALINIVERIKELRISMKNGSDFTESDIECFKSSISAIALNGYNFIMDMYQNEVSDDLWAEYGQNVLHLLG